MTWKQIGRNAANSGRINVSGSPHQQLEVEIGDAADVEVATSADIARATIDTTDAEMFLIVIPA